MAHVLARLTGYGVQLVPHWPYCFERREADARRVFVVRVMQDGEYGTDVDPENPIAVEGIVDVRTEPSPVGWRVETSTFSVPWPDGFHVSSPSDPTDRVPYYLLGPDDAAIFPQGIFPNKRVPTVEALVDAGQRITDQRTIDGIEVIELEYTHAGGDWWQCHWLIPWGETRTLVFTAQAPLDRVEMTAQAVEFVAQGSWPTGVALP
jgi:hypothetical protein